MKYLRQLVSLFVALCIGFAPQASLAVLKGTSGVGPPGAVSITGGQISGVSGVPVKLLVSGVPLVKVSSGTMGNNGAMSAITALSFAYPDAYVLLPAGAIAAGVPASADWYFAQFSTTQAATIFNNLLSANLDSTGAPTIPASPTAFATTGPGAFTGSTAEVFPLTVTVPAGALGVSGQLRVTLEVSQTSNANAKQVRVRVSGQAGTVMLRADPASFAQEKMEGVIQAAGSQAKQYSGMLGKPYSSGGGMIASASTVPVRSTVDMSVATTAVLSVQTSAAATDNLVIEAAVFEYVK